MPFYWSPLPHDALFIFLRGHFAGAGESCEFPFPLHPRISSSPFSFYTISDDIVAGLLGFRRNVSRDGDRILRTHGSLLFPRAVCLDASNYVGLTDRINYCYPFARHLTFAAFHKAKLEFMLHQLASASDIYSPAELLYNC